MLNAINLQPTLYEMEKNWVSSLKKSGVKQGCSPSPFLFSKVLEHEKNKKIQIRKEKAKGHLAAHGMTLH